MVGRGGNRDMELGWSLAGFDRRAGDSSVSVIGRPRILRRLVRAAHYAASTYARTACGQRAAAISYHVLFSLVPFVALLISVLELVLPDATQESVVSWLVGVASLPAGLADSVDAAIEDAGPPATVAGAVALAGLLWGASGMMSSVRSAFRAIWGSEADRPYLRGKLVDLLLVLGAGVLVVSAFGLNGGGGGIRTHERVAPSTVSNPPLSTAVFLAVPRSCWLEPYYSLSGTVEYCRVPSASAGFGIRPEYVHGRQRSRGGGCCGGTGGVCGCCICENVRSMRSAICFSDKPSSRHETASCKTASSTVRNMRNSWRDW
jgi:Virulence factor BrkB